MLMKWMGLLLSAALTLVACHSPVYNQTQANVADVKIRAAAARAKSDRDARPAPALLVKEGPYVDTTPIGINKHPAWMNNHIVIRGDQLPFSYYSRTIVSGARGNLITKYQNELDQSVKVSMNYSGTIKGALEELAAKTGYIYTAHTNSVYWQAFVTRTFDIAFMPGASDYLLGKKSGGGGSTASQGSGGAQVSNYVSSDSSDSEFSSLSGSISIWGDLENNIKQLLSPQGKVTVSQSTTSVTVYDHPSNVNQIAQFVANINRNLSKQVLVKIQVLEVELENDYSFGIDWRIVAKAFHNSPFVINGNYGTPVSISTFTTQTSVNGAILPAPQFGFNPAQGDRPNGIPSYTILLNALNQQGHTSIVSEPRVVCLNNQVSVVRIVKQNGYVASIQNTTNVGAGGGGTNTQNTVTSQITPGNLITGLTLYILPKIMNGNVYLQVNADLSTNDDFKRIVTAGTTVELPNITEKHFNQRSRIRSGDTLILAGMRQVSNVAKANQFLKSQALGGKGASQINRETVVLITPIILDGTL